MSHEHLRPADKPFVVGVDSATGPDEMTMSFKSFPPKSHRWSAADPPAGGNPESTRPDPVLKPVDLHKALVAIERAEEDSRRLRIVWVPERILLDAYFMPGRIKEGDRIAVLDVPGLPDGYELVPGGHYDPMRRAVGFYVRHPSFPPVPDGMEPPPHGHLQTTMRMVRVVPDDGS